jgi:LacI family transcriptional regulator
MRKNGVSLKDIAKEVGVSTDAVSKALRDSNQISEETKKELRKKLLKWDTPKISLLLL